MTAKLPVQLLFRGWNGQDSLKGEAKLMSHEKRIRFEYRSLGLHDMYSTDTSYNLAQSPMIPDDHLSFRL